MKYLRSLAGAALLATLLASPVAAEFYAGAAKVDITPPLGVSLDGSISKNGPAKSVHDNLHARALVLSDGKTKVAIVVVDQCMTAQEVFDRAKAKIAKTTDIQQSRMLMAATHTHAAPRTIHIGREPIDDEYHHLLSDKIATAVVTAHQRLAPAKVASGSFDRPELIACRRFLCEPGSVGENPFGESGERIKSVAGSSSQIIEPAGPVDGQFSVLSIRHADGAPLCVLGNFSVHYCGGYKRGAVSADYFGHYSAAVESKLTSAHSKHPPVVGIMSNGTSGNTGAFQRGARKKFEPFEGMQFYGRMLADESLKIADKLEHRNNVSIDMIQQVIKLGVRKPDKERLQWANDVLANPDKKQPHRWTKIYAQETKHLASYEPTEEVILQAIRIGDIGIASAPCEVFAETGLAIKAASPFKHTFNMELANGYGGYLPTAKQHELGGYETWPARSSFLEIEAENVIRTSLIRMLSKLAQ